MPLRLSIPCLFPQIEGLLNAEHTSGHGAPTVKIEGYDRQLAFEVGERAKEFNAFLSDVFKGSGPHDAFNRNQILHGTNPNYGKWDWSLVLVLTILEICYFTWYREELPVVIE